VQFAVTINRGTSGVKEVKAAALPGPERARGQ